MIKSLTHFSYKETNHSEGKPVVRRIIHDTSRFEEENMKYTHRIFAGALVLMAGALGLAKPSQAYSGDYCREYTRTVYIGNRREEAYGTACLRPDGQWEIVNEGNLRPVGYSNQTIIQPSRTVIVDRPTQVVYRNRAPTRVIFVGKPYHHKNYYWHNSRWDDRRHYDRGRHDRGRGRGHDRHR